MAASPLPIEFIVFSLGRSLGSVFTPLGRGVAEGEKGEWGVGNGVWGDGVEESAL
ncbi:MAG: hypothetical protein SFY66_15800 [Oculatellaceae cyanobacterium bins.114]|nr:hypothetical protein [Oculatellaceae cyanobacterium bins.114]